MTKSRQAAPAPTVDPEHTEGYWFSRLRNNSKWFMTREDFMRKRNIAVEMPEPNNRIQHEAELDKITSERSGLLAAARRDLQQAETDWHNFRTSQLLRDGSFSKEPIGDWAVHIARAKAEVQLLGEEADEIRRRLALIEKTERETRLAENEKNGRFSNSRSHGYIDGVMTFQVCGRPLCDRSGAPIPANLIKGEQAYWNAYLDIFDDGQPVRLCAYDKLIYTLRNAGVPLNKETRIEAYVQATFKKTTRELLVDWSKNF